MPFRGGLASSQSFVGPYSGMHSNSCAALLTVVFNVYIYMKNYEAIIAREKLVSKKADIFYHQYRYF